MEFDTAVISEWIERVSAYLSDDDASDTRALSEFLRLGTARTWMQRGRAICRLEGKACHGLSLGCAFSRAKPRLVVLRESVCRMVPALLHDTTYGRPRTALWPSKLG